MKDSCPTRSRARTIAERNGVSQSTVWRLIRAGRLTAHRVGRRITLIDDDEADRVFGGKWAADRASDNLFFQSNNRRTTKAKTD